MEKNTALLLGGLAVGAFALFYFLKQQQANQIAALNQPGLITQPSVAAQIGLSQIITGASNGIANLFNNGFSSDSSGLNDPGLEYDDETSFPGMDYSYSNSNSYAPSPNTPLYGGS